MRISIFVSFLFNFIFLISINSQVKVQETTVAIPSFLTEEPEGLPFFYAPEVNHGAQILVYPYSYVGKVTNEKLDKIYKALILENEYIKICVLPELGGRLYYALDKTNGYNFIYRSNVIGSRSIFGGLEWNVAQFGISDFIPADYKLETKSDGSKTIWIGRLDKYSQTRWLVSLTLYPGKSYIETSLRLLNVTPVVNNFFFQTNAAVPVNENYKVILSPERDFMAGVNPGANAGTAIVGNHYIFTGEKGSGITGSNEDAGSDGSYLELMTGMYSDNLQDYCWISPLGVKSGTIYYYPIKNLTSVGEANKDVAVNFEIKGGKAIAQIYTTSGFPGSRLVVFHKGKEIFTKEINPDPVLPFSTEIKVSGNTSPQDYTLILIAADNSELVRYTPSLKNNEPRYIKNIDPATPSSITSADQLFLEGLRIEQSKSTLLNPLPYYFEALKRDSNHVLTNTQLGIHFLKPGTYEISEEYLNKAVKTVTAAHASSRFGESLYYLGLNLFFQNRLEEAYDLLYKSSRNQELASQSFYVLALIDCLNGRYNAAIDKLSESLNYNANNVEAINLMAIILRRNGEDELAKQMISEASRVDPLNMTIAFEQYFINKRNDEKYAAKVLRSFLGDEADNYLETASRYLMAGFYGDAAELLHLARTSELTKTSKNPLIYYYLGYCYAMNNQPEDAKTWFSNAAVMSFDNSFPYGATSYSVLKEALKVNANDALANYLLGNLLYNNAPAAALKAWEKAENIAPAHQISRNIAFAIANNKPEEAISRLDKALASGVTNPVYLLERDVYAAYALANPADRLAFIEKYKNIASAWDKLELRRAELFNLAGRYNDAIAILKTQKISMEENAAVNPQAVLVNALLASGIKALKANDADQAIVNFNEAVSLFQATEVLRGVVANYLLGKAYKQKGDNKKAKEYFAVFTNINMPGNAPALTSYYQALALKELGNTERAVEIFNKLKDDGNKLLNKNYHEASYDQSVQARFLKIRDKAEGFFYIGLGNKGLGNEVEADNYLKKVEETDPSFFDIKLAEM